MRHWITATTLTLLLVTANSFAVKRLSTDNSEQLRRKSFSGKITSISGQTAVVKTTSGNVTVNLGPQSYWNERGYHLRSGVEVDVVGWYEDDRNDYCYGGSIAGRGFNYELCDNRGYPRWGDRDDCDYNWRPRRSSFNIFFSLGSFHGFDCAPPPRHHHHHRDYCPPPRHHHHDRDRDHGGWDDRDRDRDRDHDRNRDHRRGGERDRGGRRGRG